MTDLLKASDLKEMGADELLEMDADLVADVGFITPPDAVYQAKFNAEIVTGENLKKEPFTRIEVKATITNVIELIRGANLEAPEELMTEDADGNVGLKAGVLPEYIMYGYFFPGRGANFKTDFLPICKEITGKDSLTFREMIEALQNVDLEFTYTTYRAFDKDHPEAEPKLYPNIKGISLITV